jgi:hypothetical protein
MTAPWWGESLFNSELYIQNKYGCRPKMSLAWVAPQIVLLAHDRGDPRAGVLAPRNRVVPPQQWWLRMAEVELETEMVQHVTRPLLVRTRLVAAQQRLAFAGLLNDRLAERAAVPQPDTDVLERAAEALPPPAFECVFSALGDLEGEFDRCGALYHLATQGNSASSGSVRPWQNPAGEWAEDHSGQCPTYSQKVVGRVAVSWSSVGRGFSGPPSNFVCGPAREGFIGPPGSVSSTGDEHPRPWMAIDLGESRRMKVAGYALRNGGNPPWALRHWELQGSAMAEGPWATLDARQGDETITGRWGAGYWSVNQETESGDAIRHVRIVQTGKNAAGFHHLCSAGLELYGVLLEVA